MTVTVRDVYDLTPLQQGMLFHALLEPESQLYVEQITVPFAGAVAWPAFQRAWQDVADHHDALRTSFHWSGIATPVQVVHADAPMSVDAIDLLDASGRPGPRRLADVQASDRARGFDLERPPLFRVALVRSGPGDVALVLSFHHMILDGWSLQLVLRDFGTAYRQRARGEVPRLPPAGRYRDYLLWLQSQDLDAAERHWRETLRGAGGPTPLWSDGTTSAGAFADHEAVVSLAATEAAERAAAQSRVTLNTVAQAAWALALGLSTGSDDVTFGITVSGRPGELDNVEQMVGLFINTIPLRLRIDPDASVAGWLRDVQRRMVEARQFEYSPLVDVHRWGGFPAGTPLFDSIVAFENYPIAVARNGDAAAPATFAERTNYPLSAVIVPGERLRLRVLFDERHLHRSAVERLAERYEMMLVALGGEPHRLLRELPTLTPSDAAVIDGWHSPPRRLAPRTVHENFERSAAAHADDIALEFGDRTWTFASSTRRPKHSPNGSSMPASTSTIGSGCSPSVRRVRDRPARHAESRRGLRTPRPEQSGVTTAGDPRRHRRVTDPGAGRARPGHRRSRGQCVVGAGRGPGQPAAATSAARTSGPERGGLRHVHVGLTGEPKGTVVPHQAINRLVLGADYLQIGPDDRIVHLSNCSFDAATFEIWGALLNGARLVGVDEDTALRPDRFARFLAERSITVVFVTTALLNRIAAERPAAFATVDVVLFGGEAVDPKWVRRIRDAARRAGCSTCTDRPRPRRSRRGTSRPRRRRRRHGSDRAGDREHHRPRARPVHAPDAHRRRRRAVCRGHRRGARLPGPTGRHGRTFRPRSDRDR